MRIGLRRLTGRDQYLRRPWLLRVLEAVVLALVVSLAGPWLGAPWLRLDRPATVEGASAFSCTLVIGFSVTEQWFENADIGPSTFESIVGSDTWELLWQGGGSARYWASPDYAGWTNALTSPCTQNATIPDRLLLDITRDEYVTDPQIIEADIRGEIATARQKYPSVRQIILQPIVGGPSHQVCPSPGAEQGAVRASYNHAAIDAAIDAVVGGDVVRGADPLVGSCADYRDDVGHLTVDGELAAGRFLGNFYLQFDGAAQPPALPTVTPTAAAPSTATPTVTSTSGGGSTIWAPAVASQVDPNAVELGLKFRADVDGTVTGVRFYKGSANSGTHAGHLWTASGQLLGSVTFAGESATGWQQATFAQPIAITAGTTYVISYHAPAGGYAVDQDFFVSAGVDNGPLHAPSSGAGGGNGVYRYGAAGSFPTDTYRASNYWVDVVFAAGSGQSLVVAPLTTEALTADTATARAPATPTATAIVAAPTATPTATAIVAAPTATPTATAIVAAPTAPFATRTPDPLTGTPAPSVLATPTAVAGI